jgi:predicted regulator of Ras-like GTPase activity (Roadblock/LC7/MglB family)
MAEVDGVIGMVVGDKDALPVAGPHPRLDELDADA